MRPIEIADHTERRGAEAFARLTHGLCTENLDAHSRQRRAVLAAVAFAWSAHRAQADASRAEVERYIEEAAALDRERRLLTAEQPYPIELQQSVRHARTEIDNALEAAESDLLGLELALEHVASILGFDADAGRRLVGVTRWRSSNVDQDEVESRRRLTVDYLLQLAEKLES